MSYHDLKQDKHGLMNEELWYINLSINIGHKATTWRIYILLIWIYLPV